MEAARWKGYPPPGGPEPFAGPALSARPPRVTPVMDAAPNLALLCRP